MIYVSVYSLIYVLFFALFYLCIRLYIKHVHGCSPSDFPFGKMNNKSACVINITLLNKSKLARVGKNVKC